MRRSVVFGALIPLVVVSIAAAANEIGTDAQIVRSGPSPRYRVVGTLSEGTRIKITGKASRNYVPVRYTGGRGRGWVPANSVRKVGRKKKSSQPGALGSHPKSKAKKKAAKKKAAKKKAAKKKAAKKKAAKKKAAKKKAAKKKAAKKRGVLSSNPQTKKAGQTTKKSPGSRSSGPQKSSQSPGSKSKGKLKNALKKVGQSLLKNVVGGSKNTRGSSNPFAAAAKALLGGSTGKKATITGDAIVRNGPGNQFRAITLLFPPAEVTITSNSNGWYGITQDTGATGFVHGSFLGKSSSLEDSSINGGVNSKLPGSSGAGKPPGAGNETKGRTGFIQLKASGDGYYTYYNAKAKWGQPRLIYAIMRIGKRLKAGGLPRLGVGDISLKNGGNIAGHASHKKGVDVDCRLMFSDKTEHAGTIDDPTYSSAWTTTAIRLFREEISVTQLFFNDKSTIKAGYSSYWKNHANHFHVRVR
ncbi:MAG: penicillin-insensitive murein endopeptidase [Planctomycetes bacterium]|nr:penicillin-insensitive murein endopeptidase [Planctomycetota bacterium]